MLLEMVRKSSEIKLRPLQYLNTLVNFSNAIESKE